MKKIIFFCILILSSNFINSSQTDIDAQVAIATTKITDASKSLVDFLDAQKKALFKDFHDNYDTITEAYRKKLSDDITDIRDQKNAGKLAAQLKDPASTNNYVMGILSGFSALSTKQSEAFHDILKKKSIEMHKNFKKAGQDMLAKNKEANQYINAQMSKLAKKQFETKDDAVEFHDNAVQASKQIHDIAVQNQKLITDTSINIAHEVTDESQQTLKEFNERLEDINKQYMEQLEAIITGAPAPTPKSTLKGRKTKAKNP